MLIRIGSIVSEDVAQLFREATDALEKKISPAFTTSTYGGAVDQFSAISVCVDTDPVENKRFMGAYDKCGTYKDPATNKRVKYISFALPFNPEEAKFATTTQIIEEICAKLKSRLDAPGMRMPNGFGFDQFRQDLRNVIDAVPQVKD